MSAVSVLTKWGNRIGGTDSEEQIIRGLFPGRNVDPAGRNASRIITCSPSSVMFEVEVVHVVEGSHQVCVNGERIAHQKPSNHPFALSFV